MLEKAVEEQANCLFRNHSSTYSKIIVDPFMQQCAALGSLLDHKELISIPEAMETTMTVTVPPPVVTSLAIAIASLISSNPSSPPLIVTTHMVPYVPAVTLFSTALNTTTHCFPSGFLHISTATSSYGVPSCVRVFGDGLHLKGLRLQLLRLAGVDLLLQTFSEYLEEPQTKVKYQTSLSLPGCSSSLSLLGTGQLWEKVFAIIGVKVYAAGLYANPSIFSKLDAWKGRSSAELHKDSSLFDAIYQAPLEKSLHIILVRDLDGKTFWDALDEALSPRIKSPTPVDETALSTFRGIFQGRPLQKGTSIFLTWLDTAKMLFFVTPEGIPSSVDAAIESSNVTSALFDVFLGGNPVSPSLRASACIGLAAALK
ncbi:hypothetical protein SASPL_117968 [Salvia splendens]|uniref:Chalcone-flavonone isomerase family protein n=1 Tax=Salvia splendens TaxID=180675 RepID=A0A8X8XVX3_SALSN|nr:hypothetical protein SASPL_117968 [Salvia splendens]